MSRATVWVSGALFSLLALAGAAQAACDLNTASTSGVTATFTTVGQTIGICVSDDKVRWGLFSTQNVATNYNYPISNAAVPTSNAFVYANYVVNTGKATYRFVPLHGAATGTATQEYDVTLQSVTAGGADSVTLYYASQCSESANGCTGPPFAPAPDTTTATGPANTAFVFTLNLPAVAPTIAAAFSPTSITTASTSTLTLTLNNPNASIALSGVAVAAAALPPNLAGTGVATTCGGTATYSGGIAGNLSLSGASLAGGASCTVTLTVSSTVAANYNYTTGVVSSTTPATTGTTATTPTALTVTSLLTTTQAVPSTVLTAGTAATPFTPVTASGGTAPLSFALSGGTLPTGLAFSTTSGQITGTPTTLLATTTFTVTVTDSTAPTAQTSAKTFSLTVNPPPLTTTQAVPSTILTAGTAATPFTPVTASGGFGTVTFALSGATLPTGLTFSTTSGQISGTPSTLLAATTFTVTVTDSTTPTAQTSAKTFSLTVNPPPLTTTQAVPSTTLTAGTAASFTPVTASGGFGTLSYALTGGTLPTGLTFSTTSGQIAGTPSTLLATTTFTVTVTDSTAPTAQTSAKTFSLTVSPPPLTTTQAVPSTTLTAGTAATPFTPVTASGGFGTLSFALTGGTLPTGLTFSTTSGQIAGTPTMALAATTFTVTATDQTTPTAQTSAKTFSLTVNAPTITLAPTTLPNPVIGTAYNQTVTASGGIANYSYAVTLGALPTGITFASSASGGALSGNPTAAGTFNFTITATDANNFTGSQAYTVTVAAPTLAISPVSGTNFGGTSGVAYSQTFTPSGGTGSFTFSPLTINSGTLPTGITFNTATGVLSGTPTTLGAVNFTVTATNSATGTGAPFTVSGTYTLTIAPPGLSTTQAVPATTLTAGTAAPPFTPVTASGGFGTVTFALSGATLPTGLTFSTANGQISGTPMTLLATTTFTVTATDQSTPTAQTSSKTFTLTVNPSTLTTTQAVPATTLTSGTSATPFTPVTASGGFGTLSYALSGGTLPTGLAFNTTNGQISGTPTTLLAATTFTVTVTDQTTPTAQTSAKTFSLTVNPPALTTTQAVPATTLTVGTAATPFTPVTASGGFGTLSYALSGGTLPAGLTFSTANGQISGTPTTTLATTTFTVTVTDQTTPTAQTSSKTFSLTVKPPAPTVMAINPTSGPTSGGTSVTISGTNFTGATGVTIGGAAATGVVVNSATSITATTPAGAAGPASVVVTTSGGANAANALYTYIAPLIPPTVASITPNAGPTSGGTSVTISGTNFTGATGVTIGGTAATGVTVVNATTITATTPAGTAGAQSVLVTTLGGTNAANTLYTYLGPPTVTSIAPNTGSTAGGTNVTITGTNFTGATGVTIGGTAATGVTVVSATTITATTPAGAAGPVSVLVTTSGGTNAANTLYTYVVPATLPPTVTSINPSSGPAGGGTSVTISGSNFTGATAVTIGGAAATGINVVSPTSITAITPAHGAGTVDVAVTTPNGTGTGSGLYTYVLPATTTAVTSSRNPSEVGQAVTFTATVSSTTGTPAGTVVFNDGGTSIGSASLASGVASLTTSALTLGSHTITAVFAGNSNFAGSTSAALQQSVNTPKDSLNLRALQIAATKVIAQTSGAAITGAIDTAISDGFGGEGGFMTPSAGGIRFNFSADPDQSDRIAGPTVANTVGDQRSAINGGVDSGRSRPSGGRSRVDDAFAAIDRKAMPTKASPIRASDPRDWLFWADIRGAGVGQFASSSGPSVLYGNQVNLLLGVTRRVTPNLVVGAVGGYETFDYRSDTLNGRLKGDGWTIGSYLGWKFAPGLRFDAAAAYSGIGYDGTSGTANGSFSGHRWLVSGGLIGSTTFYGLAVEPSAKIYALWENENAYTDSLGTLQADRTFFTGRASGGVKVAYPWLYSATVALSPFAGLYGDYYFTGDNAAIAALAGTVPLASVALLDGWSARAVGGVAARFANGAAVTVGAEFGGLGSNVQIWTFKGQASVPFSAQ